MPLGILPGSSIAERVAYLASGFAFHRSDRPVTVVETHTSWIFMGRTRVLKMKKPIHLPFLDFTTLPSRHRNAISETRLNRRLAPSIYYDPVPLRLDSTGQYSVFGEGTIVDWLVDMRRLPHAEMMDERIRARRLAKDDVLRLAELMAGFYRSLSSPPDRGAYLRHLEVEQSLTRRVLGDPRLELDLRRLAGLCDRFDALLARARPAIEMRIAEGRIVEGHGDLRPCHVCLIEPPVVFDCLEFDRNMRLIDPIDELGYLGLECGMLGARWVRDELVGSVLEALDDRPWPQLTHIYGAFRMLLRARLCAAHLLEPPTRESTRWMRLTKRYLSVANREIRAADATAVVRIRHHAGA